MDNQRLLIWAFFGLMAWMTYQTWLQDYGPKPVAPVDRQHRAVNTASSAWRRAMEDDLPELGQPDPATSFPIDRQCSSRIGDNDRTEHPRQDRRVGGRDQPARRHAAERGNAEVPGCER